MLGLIKKDLLMIKSNLKLVLIVFIVFFIMAIQGGFDISFAPAFISVMLFMSTFSYDEYNKWDAYAITFPNGRKNIVKSKYIATLILIFVSIVITILLSIIVGYLKNDINYESIFSIMAGCGFSVILIQSIMYPLIFKFGIEKGRMGLFIGAFGITAIIGMFSKVINVKIPPHFLLFIENYWIIVVAIVTIIMLAISYIISQKIYLKKEF